MEQDYSKTGFYILKEKAWTYHFGIHICFTGFEKEYNKIYPGQNYPISKDIYIFLCIGKLDISIGYEWIPKKRLEAYKRNINEEVF